MINLKIITFKIKDIKSLQLVKNLMKIIILIIKVIIYLMFLQIMHQIILIQVQDHTWMFGMHFSINMLEWDIQNSRCLNYIKTVKTNEKHNFIYNL